MPRYRVTNRVTHERYDVEAPFAQDACERLGWLIGNCHVELLREGPFTHWERPVNRTDIMAWARREIDRQMAEAKPADPDEELPF